MGHSGEVTPHALLVIGRLVAAPMLVTQTDERLCDLARAGSVSAFDVLESRYREALIGYCTKILPPERAEDVVQQTLTKAYQALLKEGSDLALRPWLYRVAHNGCLDVLRDRAMRHEQLDDHRAGVEVDLPEEIVERRERLHEVVGAVRALPDRQREAIVLRELEGRSYEEIASSLHVTDAAVRQLLNRARTTLRRGASMLTPPGLLTRAAGIGGESTASRTLEACAVSRGGTMLANVCATVLVTGGIIGGPAIMSGGEAPNRSVTQASVAPPAVPSAPEGREPAPGKAPNSAPLLPANDPGPPPQPETSPTETPRPPQPDAAPHKVAHAPLAFNPTTPSVSKLPAGGTVTLPPPDESDDPPRPARASEWRPFPPGR